MAGTDAFDKMVAIIDYPVFVVTAVAEGRRSGCLVGFATQTSIDPRRFLIGISQANHTHGVATSAEYLAVHLIPADQKELAELFGGQTGDEIDKFEHCRWSEGPYGLPILEDSERWFAARVLERIDVGDHTAHIVEPVDGAVSDDDPSRDSWAGFADTLHIEPGHDA
ncbi:NADH-FMN oxidoreductase RutF, flavin reductase (DIM6/NTAB) family [Gordonia westfalica]|uniref:NADH-FMN oxidoreductase RutF, flavin reductase (DIM6/NTAB) family n=2 Tax=Gordonia westfalica TaxID=158898 RepID=A0A1H2IUW2_9ACTN|nr:NADH-FMN oxidoreductase RutF, flavin reductase (DIM6/NTAB) family [Gordonia westfalica]